MILYVDASKTGAPPFPGQTCGQSQWRGVKEDPPGSKTHREVFRSKIYPKGHNNAAEFIAIIEGIQWIQSQDPSWRTALPGTHTLYSDSMIAISWVVKGKTKCGIRNQFDTDFKAVFEAAESWLTNQSAEDRSIFIPWIQQWDTTTQGQIPADFGNK